MALGVVLRFLLWPLSAFLCSAGQCGNYSPMTAWFQHNNCSLYLCKHVSRDVSQAARMSRNVEQISCKWYSRQRTRCTTCCDCWNDNPDSMPRRRPHNQIPNVPQAWFPSREWGRHNGFNRSEKLIWNTAESSQAIWPWCESANYQCGMKNCLYSEGVRCKSAREYRRKSIASRLFLGKRSNDENKRRINRITC